MIRNSVQDLNIINLERGVYKESIAITVLNSEGFEFAVFSESYDKLSKLKNIAISYYDKEGKLIKKVKKGDIEDYNITSSGSIYDDNRMKYYEPSEYAYPFTIEYSYSSQFESTAYFQPFNPQFVDGISVEKASYSATVPQGYQLRFKELNGIEPHTFSESEDGDTYKWEIKNQATIKKVYAGKAARYRGQHVKLGPSKFVMEGYEGDLSTWKEFGAWQVKLNQGRDEISDKVKKEIDELLLGIDNPREKTRLIYQYLQRNTRYVSIQLGIGGFQPFDAMNVIENGYGDCKALSNFTYSLLKYAGILSHFVVIKAGPDEEDIDVDFPSFQFNHVIVAVPMEKDTVWLECTSQKAPFNFLGSFTDDRHALMITDEGGVIVKTPEYEEKVNTQRRVAEVNVDAEGNISAKVKTTFKGRQFDDHYHRAKWGKEDQKKYLLNVIDLPAFDLKSFSYEENRETEIPFLQEEINLQVRKYATKSGKRLFLVPNLLNRSRKDPPKDDSRETSIIVKYGYEDVDSVSYTLPENYRLEFQLEDVEVSTEFGEYKLSYKFDPETNQLKFTRYLLVKEGEFPAESYKDFRDFFRKVRRSDVSKLVLIGET